MKATMIRTWRLAGLCVLAFAVAAAGAGSNALTMARDRQDTAALDSIVKEYQQALQKNPNAPDANYRVALAYSYSAEVNTEKHDKKKAESMAESGLGAARKAVSQDPSNAEYHRLLGELCGQVIPANPILGALKYGQCARDEITRALQLNANLALAYLSRGVGNYYLPASMGGGTDIALKDLDKAIALDPNSADAYLWKGVVLRKVNRDADARKAFERSLQLNPNRIWAKEQLDKTPLR